MTARPPDRNRTAVRTRAPVVGAIFVAQSNRRPNLSMTIHCRSCGTLRHFNPRGISMINRREFLGYTATAGAGLVLAPELLRALQSSANLIQRAIPSSGEKLP